MSVKTEICIEKLLQWAYRDELSKRQTSSAEGIWDRILEEGQRGAGIDRDPGHGAAQRYAHFGLPDPDAERIEQAVGRLEDGVIDWGQSFDAIAGELSGLISINDVAPRPKAPKTPKSTWGAAGDKALKAWWGDKGAQPLHDRPRDVLMVGGLRTGALVTMHAVKGTRPDWIEDSPQPQPTPAVSGPNAMVLGKCEGKNRYSLGSYCPLRWSPSPLSIVSSRAEYVAWHCGLTKLAETLRLEKFTVLPPKASITPWLDCRAETENSIKPVLPTPTNGVDRWGTLPLAPVREKVGRMARSRRNSEVRYPLEEKTI